MKQENIRPYRYGSHLPILRTLFDMYPIDEVTELGTGLFSTKFFLSKGVKLRSIENDKKWIDQLKTLCPNHAIEHHDVTGLGITDQVIPPSMMPEIVKYYNSGFKGNLLFVDQYTALRSLSIEMLHKNFDIIVFHDSEAKYYGYEKLKFSSEYKRIDCKVLPVQTSFLIKESRFVFEYLPDIFWPKLAKYVKSYKEEFGA